MKYAARLTIAVITGLLIADFAEAENCDYDVVVVGATPAGIAAAVNAGRTGKTVLLAEPTQHIGGLTSGGLSNTDFETFQSLGGTWGEFMDRVVDHYSTTYGPSSSQVASCRAGGFYEPSVARSVFDDMLAEAGVVVQLGRRVTGASTTVNASGRRQLTGATFTPIGGGAPEAVSGSVFVDASYEGDLLARAGGDYRIGNVQTYNFRVTMSHDPANQVAFSDVKPPRYEQMDFSAFRDYLVAHPSKGLESQVKIRMDLNGKADFNGKAYTADHHFTIDGDGWTEGSPEYRQAMFDLAKTRTQAFFHFLATDPALSGHRIQQEANEWGYAADEFDDSDNFPPALYVREGRKMVGVYQIGRNDRDTVAGSHRTRAHLHAIAIADYVSVAHSQTSSYGLTVDHFLAEGAEITDDWPEVSSSGSSQTDQFLPVADLPDWPDGETQPSGSRLPYSVPYGTIVPVSLDGLLVPVAVSADNTMYNSMRMEPTWTALGQAAGLAAVLALEEDQHLRDLDPTQLQLLLHGLGAKTFYASDVDADSPHFEAVQFFGNRGLFHNTQLIASDTRYDAPVSLGGTQWSHSFRYHDIQPDRVLTEEVETWWRQQLREVYGEGFFLPHVEGLQADGDLTRGEWLSNAYAEVIPEPASPSLLAIGGMALLRRRKR